MKKILFLTLLAAFFSASCPSCQRETIVGKPTPGFTLKAFDGRRLSPGELKGKPVILYFFASW